MKTRLILLAVLLVLTAVVVILFPQAEDVPPEEAAAAELPAPPEDYRAENDFTFRAYRTETNESGLAVTLSELCALSQYAGEPVVVTFWASWNSPSREQLEVLAALSEDGTVVLPVNVGKAGKDSEKKARAALGEKELSSVLPLLVDQTGVVRYNVTSTPRTVVFAANGEITADLSGPCTAQEIRAALERAG